MVERVVIELTLEQQKAIKSLNRLSVTAKNTEKVVEKSFKGMGSAASSFLGNLAAIGAAKALGILKDQVFGVVDAATKLEVYETQFETFLKSADAARDHLEDLVNFAATTPFQLPGIADASKKLLAFGVEQEELIPLLTQLGNAAAATGNEMADIALIFGQVQAAGKLTGERMIQLTERGINVGPALAKSLGVAESALEDLRAKGQISAEDFNKAFESLTTGTGRFAGGMIRQSKTFGGVISTLKDNFFALQVEIGKTLTPQLKEIAIDITKEMAEFAKEVKDNGPTIAKQFKAIAGAAIETAKAMGIVARTIFELSAFAASGSIGEDIADGFDAKRVEELDTNISNIQNRINELNQDIQDRASGDQGIFSSLIDKRSTAELESEFNKLISKMAKLKTQRDVLSQGEVTILSKEAIEASSALIDDQAAKTINKDKKTKETLTQNELLFRENLKTIQEESDLAIKESEIAKRLLDEEADVEKLESLAKQVGLENAIKITAMEELAELEKKDGDRKLALAKANSTKEILLAKKTTKAVVKNEEQKQATTRDMLQASGRALDGFGALAAAVTNDNFKVQKAFAIATIPVNTAVAISQASTLPIPANYVAMAAAAALGAAQLIKAVNSKPPSFQDGGIVDFGSPVSSTDNQIAEVASGELILTAQDQTNLLETIRSPNQQGSPNIIVEIDGFAVASAMREAQTDGARI